MKPIPGTILIAAVTAVTSGAAGDDRAARGTVVRTTGQLVAALTRARPGTTVLIAPGVYGGGILVERVQGTRARPITIRGLDPARKPVIRGGGDGLKLTDPAFLIISDLAIEGASGVGIHLDDGGNYETPGHDIQILNVTIRGTGDHGIKLTGIDRVRIEGISIEGWAGDGACGINVIGCHDVRIKGVSLVNRDDRGFGGIQLKGGCSDVVIVGSRFVRCGTRAVQIGGHTGPQFMRPPGQDTEARRVTIRNNVLVGGEASLAFASCREVSVVENTIYLPKTWVLRILQENNGTAILPTGDVSLANNIVVYQPSGYFEVVNIGPGTAPESFRFEGNWWYRRDRPDVSRPSLPAAESGGVYGEDPRFREPDALDLRPEPSSPAATRGAYSTPAVTRSKPR